MIENINYKIYCTYHDKKFINEYNLKETNNFKLFYTKDNLEGYSLNYAQLYLNEYVTQYYVWKNQIKSDYVGFCHYRRIFDVNETIVNALKNNNVYTHIYGKTPNKLNIIFKECGLEYTINNIFIEFLNLYYKKYVNKFIDYINDDNIYFSWGELYMCKWDIFNQLMIFIDKYIKYIFNTTNELYNISLDEYDKKTHELNNKNYDLFSLYWNSINEITKNKPFFGYPRCLAFSIEYIIGIYLNCFINIK